MGDRVREGEGGRNRRGHPGADALGSITANLRFASFYETINSQNSQEH
jgi:hypothetical protein